MLCNVCCSVNFPRTLKFAEDFDCSNRSLFANHNKHFVNAWVETWDSVSKMQSTSKPSLIRHFAGLCRTYFVALFTKIPGFHSTLQYRLPKSKLFHKVTNFLSTIGTRHRIWFFWHYRFHLLKGLHSTLHALKIIKF